MAGLTKLTHQNIEAVGFRRVNNSMWRRNNITLQSGHTIGRTLLERIFHWKEAYRVCIFGVYYNTVEHLEELEGIIEFFDEENL